MQQYILRDPERVSSRDRYKPTRFVDVPRHAHEQVGERRIGVQHRSEDAYQAAECPATAADSTIGHAPRCTEFDKLARLREWARGNRDQHDGIIQDLYTGVLRLEDLTENLPVGTTREQLQDIAAFLSRIIGDVRAGVPVQYIKQGDGQGNATHKA
jgi:hypothetical protein